MPAVCTIFFSRAELHPEPDRTFRSHNLVSNEVWQAYVIPELDNRPPTDLNGGLTKYRDGRRNARAATDRRGLLRMVGLNWELLADCLDRLLPPIVGVRIPDLEERQMITKEVNSAWALI